MKIRRYILAILASAVSLVLASCSCMGSCAGCAGTKEEETQVPGETTTQAYEETTPPPIVELTGRQYGIMDELGWPEAYISLDTEQKLDIIAIEEILRHMEEEYGGGYEFFGYSRARMPKDSYTVQCYDASLSDEFVVTVTRVCTLNADNTRSYAYSDNYPEVMLAADYSEAMAVHLDGSIGDGYIIGTALADVEEGATASDIVERCRCYSRILVDSGRYDKDDLLAFAGEFAEWFTSEHTRLGTFEFSLVPTKAFEGISSRVVSEGRCTDLIYLYGRDAMIQARILPDQDYEIAEVDDGT